MALHKEQERLSRELGSKDVLFGSLCNQANLLKNYGYPDDAMALYKEAEQLSRELGNKNGLQASLNNQAMILTTRGDLDGAMPLYKESERLCRELDNPERLSISLANQADALKRIPSRKGEARRLAQQALAIAARHGYQRLVPQFQHICDSIPSN